MIKNKENYAYFKKSIQDKENSSYDLLLAAIALDTSNFVADLKESKWVDIDQRIANLVLKYNNTSIFNDNNLNINSNKNSAEINESAYYIDLLFNVLSGVKFNIEKNLNLSLDALVNKDRKDLETKIKYKNKEVHFKAIFSSLPVSMEKITEKHTTEKVSEFLNLLCKNEKANLVVFIYKTEEVNETFNFVYKGEEDFNKDKNPFVEKNYVEGYYNALVKDIKDHQPKKFDLSFDKDSKLIDSKANNGNDFFVFNAKGGINRKFVWPNLIAFLASLSS